MYDPDAAQIAPFCASDAVLSWYDRHRRDLPWRAKPLEPADPYAVWLSEIMLQQTTVAAVKPYFSAFLARWPSVHDLAASPIEEVMREWAGLGYYSRARNLHACAKMIAGAFEGRFPQSEAELRRLPGIGPYTAAAIAAIAFGRRAVVVDGNVERVVARLFAIEAPLPSVRPLIRAKADVLTPHERPGDFAQGMMDLGATICTPRSPACAICPLSDFCEGRRSGDPARFPVKAPKAVRPRRRGAAFYICREDGAVMLRTRPNKGLLGGMSEVPGSVWDADFDPAAALGQAPMRVPFKRLDVTIEHVFTHFSLTLEVFAAAAPLAQEAPAGCRWVAPADLSREALPGVMRKVLEAVGRGGDLKPNGEQARQAKPRAPRAIASMADAG
ncbi:A/G-specific adenine glycosylase [Methylocapsa palsarum]|uniref:Adenine DNA glycosylase n=1 Tax=Methylocapsa palsarum TaxID=1612308 RepID=A0A1I3Z4H5_9HYPH|nr:A/G-specific adenine glycosylase [Methylocapsa palsarum]SFK38910.1 A/G-specific adenine glycosylase [Methylocapsa palsarum]